MMRAALIFIVLVSTLAGGQPTHSQQWTPPQDSVLDATGVIDRYFSLLDNGDPKRAHEMMNDTAKASIPVTAFIQQNELFRSQAGRLLERRLLKFTWHKDPAGAPFPGIYAAVDIAARYDKIDRHCGYVVLYQRPSEKTFQVMRAENNFIDNETAKKIETTKSKLELDKAWASLSRNCPNFPSTAKP